jgi:hypothetical protein
MACKAMKAIPDMTKQPASVTTKLISSKESANMLFQSASKHQASSMPQAQTPLAQRKAD